MPPRHPSVEVPFSSPEGWDKLALCVHVRVRARECSGGQSITTLLDVCFCYSAPVGMCIGLVSETTALPRKGVLK